MLVTHITLPFCADLYAYYGAEALTIQEVLGHAQLSITFIYTHAWDDRRSNALTQMSEQIMENADEKVGNKK